MLKHTIQSVISGRYRLEILVMGLAIGLHFFNIVGFPSYFVDEGAYIGRALVFKDTGDPTAPDGTFYYHPFLVWILLGILFLGTNFPSFWNNSIESLYFLPRSFFAFISVIDVLLLYKIVLRVYGRRDYALLSSAFLAVTPLSVRYLRMVLLDSVMVFFVLLSLLILSQGRSIRRSGLSGLMFGLALLSKLTGLFIVIPFCLAIMSGKLEKVSLSRGSVRNSMTSLIVWGSCAALTLSVWPLYAVITGQTRGLVDSLVYQSSREAPLAWDLILSRIVERDLFLFAGIAGITYGLVRRDIIGSIFTISYLGTFVAAGIRVSSYYLIPVLPFLSILAARLLLDAAEYLPRALRGKKAVIFKQFPLVIGVLLVGILAGSGILLSSQSSTSSQIAALNYLVDNAPDGAVVVSSPSYAWTLKASRTGLLAFDWFEAPWSELPPTQKTYLIVDPGFSTAASQIPSLQLLYDKANNIEAIFQQSSFSIEIRTT